MTTQFSSSFSQAQLMPFTHEAFGIIQAIVDKDTKEPWFVAREIAGALGYATPQKAVYDHCKHSKKMTVPKQNGQRGGAQYISIIPESDVYRLIIRSNLPKAVQFESWLMEEVLPSIRRHGAFLTPAKVEEVLLNPDTIIQLATALKEERAAKALAEQALAVAAPKAKLVDVTFANRCEQLMSVTEVARKLDGLNLNRIKSDLQKLGYFYKVKAQYRVYAKFRDVYFVEKFDARQGKQDIYATKKGATLIADLFKASKLTVKVGK